MTVERGLERLRCLSSGLLVSLAGGFGLLAGFGLGLIEFGPHMVLACLVAFERPGSHKSADSQRGNEPANHVSRTVPPASV